MTPSPGEVTALLKRVKLGDQAAFHELVPLVYQELRRLAAHYMRGERRGHTLEPTAVVHEVYLRLTGLDHFDWQNRAHFVGVASHLMRRVLVDYARRRLRIKRGSGNRAAIDAARLPASVENTEEILAVDTALKRLAKWSPEQSRIVELRYFGGLSVEETAAVLGVSDRTVKRQWALAKAWLHAELSRPES
jgi:RNA polymerase sigma factor (TIGR02999 family)